VDDGQYDVEPQQALSTIILYGNKGTEGKSALMITITRILESIFAWTSSDLISKNSKWPRVDNIMKVCDISSIAHLSAGYGHLSVDTPPDRSAPVNDSPGRTFGDGGVFARPSLMIL